MHKLMCVFTAVLLGFITFNINAQTDTGRILTITTAINTAIENNLELQIFAKEILAKKFTKLQNGLYTNPELEIEAENIFGNKNFYGFNGGEITVRINQEIILAGKKSKLQKIANEDISLSEWKYEIKKREIVTGVKKVFTEALAKRELIKKNKDLLKVSEQLVENLRKRMNAGKISGAEISRAQVIHSLLEIEIDKLQNDYETKIAELQTLMNVQYKPGIYLKGILRNISSLPNYDSLVRKLMNNPLLKIYESDYKKHTAILNLEKSKVVPNLQISVGIKRLNEIDANTFLLGATVPIPIFNRNQGNIEKAKINLDQKDFEFASLKNKLNLKLNLNYKKLKRLLTSVKKIEKESIPLAEKSFETIRRGNLIGRFTILDVLDSQRTLFEIQNGYQKMLNEINRTLIEIEYLTGDINE